jgi:hypothetical protein
MRVHNLLILLCSVILSSCSNRETKEANAESVTLPQADPIPMRQNPSIKSPDFYVGFVHYLPETDEIFVVLPFLMKHNRMVNPEFYDSTIYDDTETGRRPISRELAQQFLNLDELDTLQIYDTSHRFIGQVVSPTFERIDHDMARFFGAVYRNPGMVTMDMPEKFYALSSRIGRKIERGVTTTQIEDTNVDERIKKFLPDSIREWSMTHTQLLPSGAIYSAINTADDNISESENISFVTVTREDATTIIFTQVHGNYVDTIIPVPVLINGKPIVLMSNSGLEGSDFGDVVLFFNGSFYQANHIGAY